MQKKTSLSSKCKRSQNCCDKSQYREASLREKFRMLLHLSYCHSCRHYTVTNTRLTYLLRKAKIKTCTKAEKENFQQQIQDFMARKNS
ncbi:hypothetical protein ACW6QP_14815 [Salegentibacter sp. HM20]